MRFICLGYMEEKAWDTMSASEQEATMQECLAYDDELWKNGHWIGAGECLQGARMARILRWKEGKVTATDGPFAETKEQLGGLGILEALDMDHAVELMSKHPGVRLGPFEIRPVDEAMNAVITERFNRAGQNVKDQKMSDNKAKSIGASQDLVFTRVFDAPVERVWRAWTESEQVKRWWGPTGFTCPVANMDFREGGKSLVCMRAPKEYGGQDMYSTWTYTKIVPTRQIDYTHHFADKVGKRVGPSALGLPADMPEEVRNMVTFKPVGENRTELTVTEFDWPAGQMREMSKQGMEQCLDKMAATFERR